MQESKGSVIINGERVHEGNLAAWRAGKSGILADIAAFLANYYSPQKSLPLQSSGSTGKPKRFLAPKSALLASARLSCEIFGLQAGQRALLCLPLRYIAGKMMLMRALVGGFDLRVQEPSGCPLPSTHTVDFAAMVPMQAARCMQSAEGRRALGQLRCLLLGGGFIDPALEEALQPLPCRIYVSYGMTETYSHIALRSLNGPERSAYYKPLPGVQLRCKAGGALCIDAPRLGISGLCCNDVAELLPDGRFRPLGRVDAVINSGGIKIQAEEMEAKLRQATGLETVALPLPHPVLGQAVCLLWEGCAEQESALRRAAEALPKYSRPKYYLPCRSLPRTESGKIARAICRNLAQSMVDTAGRNC